MSYCSDCGAELASGAGTCTDCGSNVATDGETATPSEKVVYAGSALSVVGAFLPWATLLGVSVSGVDGDGIITLVLGVAAAAVVYAREWDRTTNIALAVLGGLIALVALANLTNIAGSGIYVTLLGGGLVAYPGARALLG